MKHIHKKQKDSLEGSLDRVFAAKLEFPKILVPRLPKNTSNVNIEFTGKTWLLYFLCHQSLEAQIPLLYCSVINLCFQLTMRGGNCAIYGWPLSRTNPEQHARVTMEEHFCSYLVDGWLETIWKVKLKTTPCVLVDYSRFYLPPFSNIHRV